MAIRLVADDCDGKPMTRNWRTILMTALVGVIATVAVAVASAAGWLDWLELKTLDLRFRYANRMSARDDIALIAIDDRSLERAGRWPWSRAVQAALFSIPSELGAQSLLVDLTYNEPETVGLAAQFDADLVFDARAENVEPEDQILPDLTLAGALAKAAPSYLAYHCPPFDLERSDAFNQVVTLCERGDEAQAGVEARRLEQALRGRASADDTQQVLKRARLVVMLEQAPLLSEHDAAAKLGAGSAVLVEAAFRRCREAAQRRLAQKWMEADPRRWTLPAAALYPALFASLSDKPFRNDSGFKYSLANSLREVLGYQATTERALAGVAGLERVARRVDAIVPVYYLHARAAKRCGFVNFEPDGDGVMRRVRLVSQHGGKLLSQLAFSVACDQMQASVEAPAARRNEFALSSPAGRLEVQLDSAGRCVVPWISPGEAQFTSISADVLLSIAEHRRLMAQNQRARERRLAEILADPWFEMPSIAKDIATHEQLLAQVERAGLVGDRERRADLADLVRELELEIARQEAAARKKLMDAQAGAAQDGSPEGAPVGLRAALASLSEYEQSNAQMQTAVDAELAFAERKLAGRVCLIGYTATSLADQTPTPTSPRAPGVLAHANLLNGLLSQRSVRWSPGWVNALLALGLGLISTLLVTWRRPREGLIAILGIGVTYGVIAGWMAFDRYLYWVGLVGPLGAVAGGFSTVSLFRYFFVDQQRRKLATALGQYTSREIARQVAENPELCQRAETREVTAIFTDLRGFTSLSEQIGAERTQKLLNACLGEFTEVMLEHGAMVNKFIGDGIFAFWNPVIYPQADHARRACETALDLIAALTRLQQRQRAAGGDPAFDELVLRIGLATGNAVVGPCGSEQKFDYTCIGDSVNVASRLESANKFYGTSVLVNDQTCVQAGEGFVFRSLGLVQVKGRRAGVAIFELLGRTGEVAETALEYADHFRRGVELFRQRRWAEADAIFEDCAKKADDPATGRYRERIRALALAAPDGEWDGAIELSEK